jgi:tripartite-type tricarboxylate transporter receptor subunit TctC
LQVRARLRDAIVGGKKRTDMLPDVPTIAEDGLPGFEVFSWWGIIAPAGIPAPIVDRLNKELKAILDLPEMKKTFFAQGAETDYTDPAEFSKFLEAETAKWGKLIKEANIKGE